MSKKSKSNICNNYCNKDCSSQCIYFSSPSLQDLESIAWEWDEDRQCKKIIEGKFRCNYDSHVINQWNKTCSRENGPLFYKNIDTSLKFDIKLEDENQKNQN